MNLNNAHRATFRFVANAKAIQVPINARGIFGALGAIVTVANTTATEICSAFRINAVKMTPSAGGECTVFWAMNPDGEGKDDSWDDTTPTGVTLTKTLVVKPPQKSLASFWHSTITATTDQFFVLSAEVGSVIDLDISFQLGGITFSPGTFTVGTNALGLMGYQRLDGAGGKFTVLGRVPFA